MINWLYLTSAFLALLSEKKVYIRKEGGGYKKYKCGHRGPLWFVISSYGDDVREENKCVRCAIKFLRKTTRPCSECGKSIIVGNEVGSIGKKVFCSRPKCAEKHPPQGFWCGTKIIILHHAGKT